MNRARYRHVMTGDSGYLIEVDGVQRMQYDRGPTGHVESVKYNQSDWKLEEDPKPLTAFQLGQIAFECDTALCKIAGVGPRDRKTWLSMKDVDRAAWTKNGPPRSDMMRRMMFELVQSFGKVFAK